MKTTTISSLILSLLLGQFINAQVGTTFNERGYIEGRSVVTNARAEEKPTGSPYFDEAFTPAEIQGLGIVLIRYNAYRDELEMKNSLEGISAVPTQENVVIPTRDGNRAYVFLQYKTADGEQIAGYLNLITKLSTVKVYERLRVYMQPAVEPKSAYTSYKPANYKRSDIKYFIEPTAGTIVEFSSKKDLAKIFPGKEKEINAFIKSDKISLDDPQDLNKLSAFLDTLK